jgi:hypothetical protein
MSKHTPGPWYIEGGYLICTDDLEIGAVSSVDRGDDGKWCHGEATKANARLIAAAPELLQACASIMVSIASKTKYLEGCDCADCQSIRLVYAAIAKAEGSD